MSDLPFKTWDIFCRVIDNYGDIGVCWRLARQVAYEYPVQVRLWVDEIAALQHIWPGVTDTNRQELEGVDIRIWQEAFDDITPADVVVEAFACELPAQYLAAMKLRPMAPQWFNLEYLSAESWVEDCHGLFSMHPQLGLKKAFFFPGFTFRTGGLLKEASLETQRDSFQANAFNRTSFLNKLGVEASNKELLVSLFGYENPAVNALLDLWINSSSPVLCLFPPGKIMPGICKHLGQNLAVGDEFNRGSLRIKVIPFQSQTDYDRLLWACDLNFVRGEDSFVRAQWAGKPLVWHIYPQEDNVHLDKLDAFLGLYLQAAPAELHAAISEFWQGWNTGDITESRWNSCLAQLPDWQKHSRAWCQQLNSLGDLTSNMVQFCQKTL